MATVAAASRPIDETWQPWRRPANVAARVIENPKRDLSSDLSCPAWSRSAEGSRATARKQLEGIAESLRADSAAAVCGPSGTESTRVGLKVCRAGELCGTHGPLHKLCAPQVV